MTAHSPRSSRTPAFLAMSCIGSVLASGAMAQTAPAPEPQQEHALGGVTVIDTAIDDPQPGTQQESPKATRPVRDTPQTVSIISAQQIELQNLLTLREQLQTLPGITFAAGEAGGGFGDGPTLRGYTATSDITQDGVRDSGQYSRTDSFNTEQVEVTNGANSVTAGSGSVGGSINIVTKRPKANDEIIATAGIGTDNYYRATIDANKRIGDFVAVRINAMAHRNDIPGRDVENFKRWGIAPSITFGMDGPTQLTLLYTHQEDDNIPEYGAPYVAALGGLLPGASDSAYYGFKNVDKQKIRTDQLTGIIEHEFSDDVRIRNLTRYQNVRQTTWVDGPEGIYCLASTGKQANGAACTVDIDTGTGVYNITVPTGYYLPQGGPRGAVRDSRNQLAFSQTDLSATFATGGIEHTLVLGGAVTWEKYDLLSGNFQRNADGTNPYAFNAAAPNPNAHMPYLNIANPDAVVAGPSIAGATYGNNVYTGPVNFIPTAAQNGELKNYAVYVFDTLALSRQFELNVGLRYEKNQGSYRPDTISGATATSAGTTAVGTRVYNEEDLFSYRFGLVYKPSEPVSIYVAYGNSKTPSKSSVNGSCTIDKVNAATATTCSVKPETAVNYEIGVKAELGEGVLLTAAAFRNERSNYKVASQDVTVPLQQLDGKSRVNGISLGANGQITKNWTVNANYTYLDSKVLKNVANNGTAAVSDPVAGNPLTNTPKHSGSFATAYTLPFGLQIGYSVTYQGKFYLNNSGTALYQVDDYLIHNASLTYPIDRTFTAQINVKNFTNETYFTGVRNGATTNTQWARVGEGASAIATLTARF